MPGRGLQVKIEGIDQMVAALKRGEREIYNVLMDALAGKGGEAIEDFAKHLVHSRSGRVAESIGIRRMGRVVEVGFDHAVPGGNGKEKQAWIGTFLESGTQPHYINPRSRRLNARQGKSFRSGRTGLKLANGQFASHVLHPGIPAQRIMSRTLRATRGAVEAAIIAEFEKRGVAQP